MHTDPDLLSLLALGEDIGTEEERLHSETCADCASELTQLRRLVAVGRSVTADLTIATPSPHVWAGIRGALDLDATLEPPAGLSELSRSNTVESPQIERSAVTEPEDELTAHAQLTAVETVWSRASGRAELATDHLGRRVLQVALDADLPTSGFRQAWLVHRDDPNLRQTLGILDGTYGLWTVAHSIDLESYSVLDISQQDPGETAHSGRTIVRGELVLAS